MTFEVSSETIYKAEDMTKQLLPHLANTNVNFSNPVYRGCSLKVLGCDFKSAVIIEKEV
jgi:hypothetical protein